MKLFRILLLSFSPLVLCSCALCAVMQPVTLHPTKDPHAPRGVYIPQDLAEAVAELQQATTWYQRMTMRLISKDDMAAYHFSIGMWIRNVWLRPADSSPLYHYFSSRGVAHPDDMSKIILDAFWCRLHHQEFSHWERTQPHPQ